jgi:cytochrome P450 family 3 subfamily A
MYPELFSTFGYFTERLIVTEEMKFFFKLLENVLKDRSESNKVHVLHDSSNRIQAGY